MLSRFNRPECHGRGSLPWRTLVLMGLTLALYLLLGPAPELLVYQRDAISDGQWWRLITGHWVHCDSQHLMWDLLGLGVLTLLFEKQPLKLLIGVVSGATLVINIWLWFALPWLEEYCGLSGILNALLGAGLLMFWRQSEDRLYLYIGGVACIKIVLEIGNDQALFTNTTWPSVPEAHAAGIITGIAIGLLVMLKQPGEWKSSSKRLANML